MSDRPLRPVGLDIGFPFLVFYVEPADRVAVWRILQGHRDIPESLHMPSGD